MVLWEVIKALTENPSKQFKHTHLDGYVMAETQEDEDSSKAHFCYKYFNKKGKRLYLNEADYDPLLTSEWEEVRQPISWQEAIEKCANGQAVSCHTTGKISVYDVPGLIVIDPNEILHGVWYEGRE